VKQKIIDLGVDLNKTLGAAVSGGADSMALLHCLRALNIHLKVYHMEHGIRGQASIDDMEFVQKQCEMLGVECVVKRVDVPKLAEEKGVSVETAARLARYEFLDSADVEFIATAHHLDDLAETVLMNLVRGSGLNGLCGIPERRGRYIRPMIDISRAQIEEYAEKHGIEYRHDATNDDTAYTRNYIRKKILPGLKEINSSAAENIARTAKLLREDERALSDAAESAACIETGGEEVLVDTEVLMQQPSAIRKRIIRLAIARRFDLVDVENVHIDSVLRLVENGESGKRVDLKYSLFACLSYGKLVIGKPTKKKYNYSLAELKNQGRFEAGGFCFESEVLSAEDIIEFSQNAEYFDEQTVNGSVLRNRQEGDYIVPLGMKGSKRLSDYLSDRKVPLHRRDSLLVLAKDGEVFWVVGVGVSETSRIRNSRSIIKINYREKLI